MIFHLKSMINFNARVIQIRMEEGHGEIKQTRFYSFHNVLAKYEPGEGGRGISKSELKKKEGKKIPFRR